MPVTIDYFMIPLSPYVYLAGDRLERIAAARGAAIRLLPVDMPRVFAETGGLPLGQRHPARRAYRLQELRRWALKTGLPLNLAPKHFPTDARPASLAIIAADRKGKDALGLARYFLAACWAAERDIASDAVIDEGLASVGLARADIDDACARVFEENTAEAISRGVFGAPFCIVGEEMFWGQDRLDDLDRHLATLAGAPR